MTDKQTAPTLELAHTAMSEEDALRFLDGHRISRGARTMDPKAQIVGEFVKSIRVPGYYPPLPELRQQLRTMVTLMDEPAPALARIEDISIPGPAGSIGARVYVLPRQGRRRPRPVVAYFHGGGWVQGDLETHHGLCARLAERAGAIVVAVDYRLARSTSSPPPWRTASPRTAGSALARPRSAATRGVSAWPATPPAATSPPSCPSSRPPPATRFRPARR